MRNYLEFEKEIKSLEENLEKSKNPFDKDGISQVDTAKIEKIQEEINSKLKTTYSKLNSWQKTLDHMDGERMTYTKYKQVQKNMWTLLWLSVLGRASIRNPANFLNVLMSLSGMKHIFTKRKV